MSLLREIQSDVGVPESDVTTVLRKCKILASRLGSNELAQWVAWELDGYPNSQSIPDYRRLTITYFATFVNAAWRVGRAAIPPQIVPPEQQESFTSLEFRDGIAKADTFARSKNAISVARPGLEFAVQGKMYPEMECQSVWGEIAPVEFQQVLSAVRNRILDFSLSIEAENPDAGEAAPNSQPVPEEKLRPLVQNIFHGNVGAVAQNSENFNQTVSVQVSAQDVSKLVREFSAHIGELGLDSRQEQRVQAQLAVLKAESGPDSDAMTITQAGRTLRNITEGAIASLLATAAQPTVWLWIHEVLRRF